jgi:hypothetical protein
MRDPRIPALRRLAPSPRRKRGGPHWILFAALLLAAAFIEVWETTTASELSLQIEELQSKLRDGESHLALLQSQTSQAAIRQELDATAEKLGLRPADPDQIVVIPASYVAAGRVSELPEDGLAAVQDRVANLLVPEARARN